MAGSSIVFILSLFIVMLVAACFMGRYIVITKKLFIASLGIFAIQVLGLIIFNVAVAKINPALYQALDNPGNAELVAAGISADEIVLIQYAYAFIQNGAVFLLAFVIYLMANKEKKVLRAIEATVCLYIYYWYVNTMFQYAYIYLKGGKAETLLLLSAMDDTETWQLNYFSIPIFLIINIVLFLILYFRYYKKKKFYVIKISHRILFVVWLLVFSAFPSIPLAFDGLSEQYTALSHVFAVIIPILGGIVPVLLVMTVTEKSLQEKNQYQETYLQAELEYIEQYKRTQTETRAFRHDIINNLSLASMMLDEGKTEEAGQHLKDLLGDVRALSPAIITGDEMLDCIVSMKSDKMKELGIKFTLDGVADGGFNMKPIDVCSVFANALDNAIEAASKCIEEASDNGDVNIAENADGVDDVEKADDVNTDKKKTGAWVDMNIKRTAKFFVIKISNSAKQKVDVEKLFMTSGYTSKADTEHHGFGLRNIRNSVEEYDGLVKAESTDDEFALSVMIPRELV
ncbi:MAG: GHKL domain-containing protein [Eubacterium sp.]|nr:GHKL domain-containing protein [Eubacterium sp.]